MKQEDVQRSIMRSQVGNFLMTVILRGLYLYIFAAWLPIKWINVERKD